MLLAIKQVWSRRVQQRPRVPFFRHVRNQGRKTSKFRKSRFGELRATLPPQPARVRRKAGLQPLPPPGSLRTNEVVRCLPGMEPCLDSCSTDTPVRARPRTSKVSGYLRALLGIGVESNGGDAPRFNFCNLTSDFPHHSHPCPRSQTSNPSRGNNVPLIGAGKRCARLRRRSSTLPQTHFQRSLPRKCLSGGRIAGVNLRKPNIVLACLNTDHFRGPRCGLTPVSPYSGMFYV
jgi:hypothetical protein